MTCMNLDSEKWHMLLKSPKLPACLSSLKLSTDRAIKKLLGLPKGGVPYSTAKSRFNRMSGRQCVIAALL